MLSEEQMAIRDKNLQELINKLKVIDFRLNQTSTKYYIHETMRKLEEEITRLISPNKNIKVTNIITIQNSSIKLFYLNNGEILLVHPSLVVNTTNNRIFINKTGSISLVENGFPTLIDSEFISIINSIVLTRLNTLSLISGLIYKKYTVEDMERLERIKTFVREYTKELNENNFMVDYRKGEQGLRNPYIRIVIGNSVFNFSNFYLMNENYLSVLYKNFSVDLRVGEALDQIGKHTMLSKPEYKQLLDFCDIYQVNIQQAILLRKMLHYVLNKKEPLR